MLATVPIYAVTLLGSVAMLARSAGLATPALFTLGVRQATQHLYRQPGDGLLSSTTSINPRLLHLEDAEGALGPAALAAEMKKGKALFLKKEIKLGSLVIEAGEPISPPLADAFIQLGWTIEAKAPLFYNLENMRGVVPEMAPTDRPWRLTHAELQRLRQALLVPVRMEFRGFRHDDVVSTGAYAPVAALLRELTRL